jgi:hypothetical protein
MKRTEYGQGKNKWKSNYSKRCPATSREGSWRERRHISYSFSTSVLAGGERSVSRPGRALPPGNRPPVLIGKKAGWALEPVWMQKLEDKSSVSVRDRTPVVKSVVRHCTNWATPAPLIIASHVIKCPQTKLSLLQMWMSLQIAPAAETHLT